jgi:cytochrome c5
VHVHLLVAPIPNRFQYLTNRLLRREAMDAQIQATAHTPASPEPAATQETPPDGASLLESHCGQCHVPQWLEKMHKPRAEWEKIVVQMEAIGVQLSDSEEAVLLIIWPVWMSHKS